jgi:hypothetical protein
MLNQQYEKATLQALEKFYNEKKEDTALVGRISVIITLIIDNALK